MITILHFDILINKLIFFLNYKSRMLQQSTNTTLEKPPVKKTVQELRKMFWGNPKGNQLLNR